MIPFIIAGAIGYGIAKLLEEDTKKYAGGGMTNEDILRSFLTSERQTQTNNLATFYSTLGSVMLLRNYGTLIAKRNGRRVEITNVKYSKTTSAITNRLKALAEQMGYNVSYVSEFSEGGKTGANDIGEDLENYSNYDEFYNVVFDYIKREENLTEEETKDICNVNESIIEAEFDGGSSPRFTGDVVLGYLSNERAYKKFAKGGKTGEKSTKKKTIKKLTKNREPKMVRQYFDDSPYSYAGGGAIKGIKKKAEKLLEDSINYRFKNTDMGSGWLFQLESPLNKSVFNLLEEQLYLDSFSPDDMGIENYDDLSKEEQDYYYEDWKHELFESSFEAFKEKCKKHLDDFIEYIQQAKEYQDEMNEYSKGGGIKNYTKKELELFDGIFESYFNEKIDEKKILRFRNKLVTMNIGKDNPALDFVISVIDSIVDGELVPAKVQAPYEMSPFEIKAGEMGEELIKINPSYGKGKYANSFAGKDVTLNFAIKLIFSITDGKWVENKNKLASGGEAGIIHLISDNATPQREINIIEDDILRESKNFFNWKNVSVKRITSLGSTDYDKFIEFLYKKGYGKDKYAEGVEGGEAGDVEKRYGVYNYDTKNVEGYFDDLIEAEEFASQFKNVSVYEKEYLVEAIITETDYDGEYVREIPISVNIFAKDKNSAMDKADDNIREQNPQWEDFEIDIVSVEILKPFFSSKGYMVFNYTDDIYATDEVFKTKKLANDFIKEFISKFAKQGYYRDNQMNKIDVEDIDLLVIPSDFNPFGLF